MHYKGQSQNLRKKGLSMREYVAKFKIICNLLDNAGHKISDLDRILGILNGLSDEYETIVAIISSK